MFVIIADAPPVELKDLSKPSTAAPIQKIKIGIVTPEGVEKLTSLSLAIAQ